jgi:hypothetical protein
VKSSLSVLVSAALVVCLLLSLGTLGFVAREWDKERTLKVQLAKGSFIAAVHALELIKSNRVDEASDRLQNYGYAHGSMLLQWEETKDDIGFRTILMGLKRLQNTNAAHVPTVTEKRFNQLLQGQ